MDASSLRPAISHKNSQELQVVHVVGDDHAGSFVHFTIDLRSQTNPHTIDNTAVVIRTIIDKHSDNAGMDDTLHNFRRVMTRIQDISVDQNNLSFRTEAWLESLYSSDASHPQDEDAKEHPKTWSPVTSWKALILSTESLKSAIPIARKPVSRVAALRPFSVFSNTATAATYEEQEGKDRNAMEEQLRIIFAYKESCKVVPLSSRLTNWVASIVDYADSILVEDITVRSEISQHWSSDVLRSSSVLLEDSFMVENEAFQHLRADRIGSST